MEAISFLVWILLVISFGVYAYLTRPPESEDSGHNDETSEDWFW